MTQLSMPPDGSKRVLKLLRPRPVTLEEALPLIESYNAWVDVWNANEESRTPGDLPTWPDGAAVHPPFKVSVFGLAPNSRPGERLMIHIPRFRIYQRGLSNYRRNKVDPSRIVWACWSDSP